MAPIKMVDLEVITRLYDQIPNVVFFAKDESARYLAANQALVQRLGFERQDELVGQLATELFGENLGSSYEQQDIQVVETGLSIERRLELHAYNNETIGWALTSKYPILNQEGVPIGVVGISQDIRSPNMSRSDYDEVATVIEWTLKHLDQVHSIDQMTQFSGMSQFKLNQRFQAVFGLNLGQWLIKQRIDRAQEMLSRSAMSIADIALATGYSDQSALTRQFRLSTGLTPRKFRLLTRGG